MECEYCGGKGWYFTAGKYGNAEKTECEKCAESVDGAPGGACCGQCLEEGRMSKAEAEAFQAARNELFKQVDCSMCVERIRALDPPLDWDDEESVVYALESGHGVEYSTGKRRYYIDEATALADRLELSGALSLLKDAKAREAKLAEALGVAKQNMEERRTLVYSELFTEKLGKKWDEQYDTIEAALKEWEDGNAR
jgi:hypothetical protein